MIPSIFDYLPQHAETIMKIAEDGAQRRSLVHENIKIIGKGLLGFGAGSVAGLGSGVLADALSKKLTGRRLPQGMTMMAGPVLGAGAGMLYSIYKSREAEELKRVLEDQTNRRSSGFPGK